jgi:hypothetical protein
VTTGLIFGNDLGQKGCASAPNRFGAEAHPGSNEFTRAKLEGLKLVRSKRRSATVVVLTGLGLSLAACADGGYGDDGYLAYGAYPDDGSYDDGFYDDGFVGGLLGGDFHHRHDFRFHEPGCAARVTFSPGRATSSRNPAHRPSSQS